MRNRHSTLCSEVIFEAFAVEVIADFSATLHVELIVIIERDELITESFWTSIFWDFWARICSSCETDKVVTFLTTDFFFALHTDLNAWNRRDELMTDFFACCSRLCLRKNSLNLNVCLQCRHVADLFADSDSVFSVESERFERSENVFVKTISKSCKKMKFDWFSNQMSTESQKITFIHSSNSDSSYRCWHCWRCWMKMMIWLNRLFFEFWWDRVELKISKDANKDNSMIDFFIVSYTRLTVSIERDALMIEDFWIEISWCFDSNVWEDDDFNEVTKHWVDLFFFDSDTFSDVWTERCVLSCEMIVLKMNADSNICSDVADFSVDSDLASNVEDERDERFNRVTILNADADSNIEFWDLADEADDTCVTNDFFSISHTKLTALIEREEFLTSFRASWLRICSYSFLLKLKLCLQIL